MITFEEFKEEWVKKFGEPKNKFDVEFMKSKRGNFSSIWGFYDDYKTSGDIPVEVYLEEVDM